ncbi:MAG: amidase [Pseudomonadota bacterium]
MLLHEMGATALLKLLDAGRLSSLELLDAIEARYEAVNPKVNAFALALFDQARADAKRADRLRRAGKAGPLCGLPISVKDSQWLQGVPCRNGSKTLSSFVPAESCAAIERLQAAGAVIIGKTACPEFSYVGVTASHLHGETRNPWDLTRTSGGSSGGAASAVAAGIGPLSLGGDGGGSIRIPSAFCGIVGFKPSLGAVPREPCFPTWKSLAVYGPMARSVADAHLMFEAMAGFHPGDRNSFHLHDGEGVEEKIPQLKGLRLMASEDLGHAPVDKEVRSAFRKVLKKLATAGSVVEIDHPGLSSSVQPWAFTAMAEAWTSDRHHYENRPEELTPATRGALEFGREIDLASYIQAQYAREEIHKRYAAFFERSNADFLLTPTLGCPAFPLGRTWPARIENRIIEPPWIDWAGFLYDANLAGFPACALPMGRNKKGLPLSLQVIGQRGRDWEVLRLASLVEEVLEWPQVLPESLETAPLPADFPQTIAV